MQRWINPAKYGWYSGDHHVHAAGCSHYQNPTEGVRPEDMVRQIQGEKLNVGAVLTWGPCYYYQKQFFTGEDNPLSVQGRHWVPVCKELLTNVRHQRSRASRLVL
jgi:hypothetical protein